MPLSMPAENCWERPATALGHCTNSVLFDRDIPRNDNGSALNSVSNLRALVACLVRCPVIFKGKQSQGKAQMRLSQLDGEFSLYEGQQS